MPNLYLPEGRLLHTQENLSACQTLSSLSEAMAREEILEGVATLCSAAHDLTVQAGPFIGRMPRTEAALGIAEGTTREIAILSRVGKPVCFTVIGIEWDGDTPTPIFSRRRAQELALAHALNTLEPGMVVPATIAHLESFGAFVDLGCGVPSMIGIEHISVSRIPHPKSRFFPGQEIFAVVVKTDKSLGRVSLSHKELLGTWEENAALFAEGATVPGTVRGIKEYGAFIELAPNLAGLAEPRSELREGMRVSVYIKAIVPARMKIKLVVIDRLRGADEPAPLRYFITEGKLTAWRHAPDCFPQKGAQTVFCPESETT